VSKSTPVLPSKRFISAVDTSAPSSIFSSVALEDTRFPAIKRFVTLALPETSKLYEGPEVPIPNLEVELSHHRLFEPDMEVEPEKKAT